MNYANDLAKYYERDHYNDEKMAIEHPHDYKAIGDAAIKNGLDPLMGGIL